MSGNPLLDADRRDYRQSRSLRRYPKCVFCQCHIQTDLITAIDDCGQYACEECIQERTQNLDDFLADQEMSGDGYGFF